jgi:hypothetical protein
MLLQGKYIAGFAVDRLVEQLLEVFNALKRPLADTGEK